MSLYAESSAVLSWLLDEDEADRVEQLLAAEPLVLTSDLTFIECDRALHRAVGLGEITEAQAADSRAVLANLTSHWTVLRIGAEVVQRARQAFPGGPIRSLDAIHLASLLTARSAHAGITLLSLDKRVRDTATQLGIELLPATL